MTQPDPTGAPLIETSLPPTKKPPRWLEAVGPVILLILVMGMYHDVLFSDGSRILSAQQQDLTSQFVPWREWGFGLLRQGRLPLWNPHTFCGMPFVGMLQSAMFYPPNVIYLFLPIGVATNWGLALHVYLAGVLMYAFARRRGIGAIGAMVSGVTYMLCAPYIMHTLPGHVPFLAVAAWTPLVFLVADALIDSPTLGWVMLGMFAVTMQILAGYPQPAYIAAVAGSLYLGLNLAGRIAGEIFRKYRDCDDGPTKQRYIATGKSLLAWGAIYIGAAILSAAQLGAAMSTTAESGRSGGKAPFDFASSFPVPITNAVAAVVPNFWGDKVHSPYYGEWFIWEIIPYYGAAGLALALYALIAWDTRRRFAWTMVVVLMVLALGRQTPVYRIMYDYFPMFGKFRGSGKFAYGAAPFIALLAGMGWERLRAQPRHAFLLAIPALIGAGAAMHWSQQFLETAPLGVDGDWGKMLVWIDESSNPSLPPEKVVAYRQFQTQLFLPDNLAGKFGPANRIAADIAARNSAEFVSGQLKFAAVILGSLGVLLIVTMIDKRAAGLLAVLVIVEMAAYEMGIHITTPTHPAISQSWLDKAKDVKGDRILGIGPDYMNAGMTYGFDNIWGYDPVVLRRTVQFLAYSQGITDPRQQDDLVDQTPFGGMPYPFVMLRCRYAVIQTTTSALVTPIDGLPMKRLTMVGAAVTRDGRDSVLRTVFDHTFNPRSTVVLEETPSPAPQGDRGYAEIVREDTDSVEIVADNPQPTILLVTDAYSTGWRAWETNRALPDHPGESPQADEQHSYQVLPANWMLRAIPLAAGHHHFVMEYSPKEWRIGKWVSIICVPLYLASAGWMLIKRLRTHTKQNP